MAIRLQSKTNVTAPGGSYPYGDIKDDTGGNNGTPVNRAVYGDFHQFFARILDLGGVVGNDLPENSANGFQYVVALIAIIVAQATTLVSAEAALRTSADNTLQSNITAEASARGAADTTLQNNINTETSNRTSADALKSDKAQAAWINLTLGSGWTNVGLNAPRYRITDQNKFELAGIVQTNGSSATLATIASAILPSSHDINRAIINVTDSTVAKLNLSGGGSLQLSIVQSGGLVSGKQYDICMSLPLDSDN